MATLPDQVLGWLYNNLKANYRELDRCYSDLVQTLLQYPSLQPRTEIYTFDNGATALLLVLRGTVPVAFRGTSYRYPIAIWIQYGFPQDAPIVFVSPTQDMVVRPGQHVSVDGRVYHPYIANWQAQWEGSNLPALLNVLKDVFSKEPPVMARQASANGSRPPPIPPPPRPIEQQQSYPSRSSSVSQNGPPLPPPKSSGMPSTTSHQPSLSGTSDYASRGPPSLPPKPGQERERPIHNPTPQSRPMSSYDAMSSSSSHMRGQSDGGRPPPPLPHELRPADQAQPSMNSSRPRYDLPLRQNRPPPQQVQASFIPQSRLSQSTTNYAPQAPIHPPNGHPFISHPSQTNTQYTQPPSQQPQIKKPVQDLLSASLDTPLPSQNSIITTIPHLNGPPIPRNPEKDALLHAISQALHPQLVQMISQNTSALSSLTAQHTALLTAQSAMHAELSSLQSLSSTLTTNEHALHTAIASADAQIAALADRELPNIDEVLVAPTVVGEQLYRLVAEERGIAEAMFVLGRALDRGRVGGEVFVRLMRGLARERFEKKVLVGKIARGLGLDIDVGGV